MAEIADVQVRLEATVAKFERQVRRAEQSFSREVNKIERRGQKFTKSVESSFAKAAAASRTLLVALTAVSVGMVGVARSGDRIKQLEARFVALTNSGERGQKMMRDLLDLSLRTGVSIDALGTTFTRFTLAADSLGVADDKVLQFTETIIKMARLTGTAGQELDGAMRQLAQALGSGVLRGDELNSIFEAMPTVIQAIADKLGVTMGEIRDLASEGKLVSDVVFQAILDKTEEIDDAIAKLPDSVATASGKMATSWQVFTAEIDKSISASETLVATLTSAAAWLNTVSKGMENLRAGGNFGAGALNGGTPVPGAGTPGDPTGVTRPGPGAPMTSSENAAMLGLLLNGPTGVAPAKRADALRRFREADANSIFTPGAAPMEAPVPKGPGVDSYGDWLDANRPKRSGGGSSGRKDTGGDRLLEQMRERSRALEEESRLIGLTEEAHARLAAQFEKEAAFREIAAEAAKENTSLTPEEIAQAKELAERIYDQTVAMHEKELVQERLVKSTREAARQQKELADSVRDTAQQLFDAALSADSFSEAVKRVGFEILKIALSGVLGEGPMGGVLGGLFKGLIGGAFGAAGGGATSAIGGFAKGAAFRGGRVTPFANGGVVSGPATFPMPDGLGLMGEKGAEAIMPLKRGPGGRLGVEASGGGGTTVNVFPRYDPGVNGATRAMISQENAKLKADILRAVPATAAAGYAQRPALRGR